jgi:glycosyltransferase involved in cell wall biosynthesis
LFAYPSAYEGFGLPVLEAMACGVPTIASSASALIEIAGNACVTVVPGSEEDLQDAIVRLLDDEGLRRRLRAAGLSRAAEFSWERTARETVAVYEQAAGAART